MKKLLIVCIPFSIIAMDQEHLSSEQDLLDDQLLTLVQQENARPEYVQDLIDQGADVHALTELGETTLFLAADSGNKPVCRLLLQRGVLVNAPVIEGPAKGTTALIAATTGNYVSIMRLLIASGADCTIGNSKKCTPLMIAVHENYEGACRLLLTEPALPVDVNAVTDKGISALSVALGQKNMRLTRLLVEHGANVNNPKSLPALVEAGRHKAYNLIPLLIEKGGLVNYGDSTGLTLLMVLAGYGNFELCQFLLERGARTTMLTDKGADAIYFAVKQGYDAILELLLENGAPIYRTYYKNKSLLHVACQEGHTKVAGILLASGVKANAQDDAGKTPLHYAAAHGNRDLCETFIRASAKINVVDQDGGTPLLVAIENDHPDVCRLLCKTHKDTIYHEVPLLLFAIKAGSPKACKLFLPSSRMDIFRSYSYIYKNVYYEESPFEVAVRRRQVAIVRVLITKLVCIPPKNKTKSLVGRFIDVFSKDRDPYRIIFTLLRLAKKYKLPLDLLCMIIDYSEELQDCLMRVLSPRLHANKLYPNKFVPIIAPAVVRFTIAQIKEPIEESLRYCESEELLELLDSKKLQESFGEEMEKNTRAILYNNLLTPH